MVAIELEKTYRDSLKIIARNITSYVYEGETSAYKAVAVELRKLLLDENSASSFGYRGKTIFEVCAGKAKRIYLHSFDEREAKASHVYGSTNFRTITPLVYVTRRAILYSARNSSHLVTLDEWLKEDPFFDKGGMPVTVRQILQHIADKEGAHIINQMGRDIRPGMIFKITRDATNETWIADVWKDFVISAGARLLFAKKRKRGKTLEMFPNMLPIESEGKGTTTSGLNTPKEEEVVVEFQLDPSTFQDGTQLDDLINSLRVSGLST